MEIIKTISWDEFKSQNKNHHSHAELTNIACPICGRMIYKDTHIALCTYPVQYRYFCDYCEWEGHA